MSKSKLTTILENEPKVFEAGKQAEYDRFWDSYQNEVLPGNYDFRYAGAGWNKTTLKPNHDIKPKSATSMFRRCRYDGDLVELAEQQRIEIDFSECEAMTYAFYECSVARLGVIDCTAAVSLTGTFGYLYGCHTIDKIILGAKNQFASASTFRSSEFVEIRFEGVIANNGFDIHWSTKLTVASLLSILNALEDKSADTSGTSWVCTLGPENLAKLNDTQKQIATDKGWNLL